MLGDQITDLKGKVTGQKVLDAECPSIETSISSTGSAKGVRINEILTFVAKPSSTGVFHGKGQVVFSAESGMAAWTGGGNWKNDTVRHKVVWSNFHHGINWQFGVSK